MDLLFNSLIGLNVTQHRLYMAALHCGILSIASIDSSHVFCPPRLLVSYIIFGTELMNFYNRLDRGSLENESPSPGCLVKPSPGTRCDTSGCARLRVGI